MKLTEEDKSMAVSKIEKITNQLTDAYLENNISDMNGFMEIKKLTLWIVGLATALELYLLNLYSLGDVIGISKFLFISSIALFLLNSIGALYLNKMVTYLYVASLKKQRDFNLQRVLILNSIDLGLQLKNDLLSDLKSKELPLKLVNLSYLANKKETNKTATESNKSIVKIAKRFVNLSDGYASYLLILQLLVSIVLFLLN